VIPVTSGTATCARLLERHDHSDPRPHSLPEERECAAERIDFGHEIALVQWGPMHYSPEL
jgi:hypothetical protein